VELNDSQTECDLPIIVVPNIEASDSCNELPSIQDSVVNQSFDEFGSSLLSQTVAETSLPTVLEQHPTIDGSSQTDPVTIIIGDASFLVKKVIDLMHYKLNFFATIKHRRRNL
jgi:hypothetical protein